MLLYNKLDPGLYIWMYNQEDIGIRGTASITPLDDPSNIIYVRGTKEIFKQAVDSLSKTGVCKGSVNPDYIHHFSLQANNILIILYEIHKDKKTTPHGFVVARDEEDETTVNHGIYIDVICSNPGYGGKLLKYINDYADSHKYYYVGLSSLPTVLTFYPKYGFEFRKTCTGPANSELPEAITTMKKENYPKNVESTYDNKAFMDFMLDLHDKDLTVYRDPPCDNKSLSAENFKEHGCASDGFSMKKCFRRTTRRRTQSYRSKPPVRSASNQRKTLKNKLFSKLYSKLYKKSY